jgi:hypothetical protein
MPSPSESARHGSVPIFASVSSERRSLSSSVSVVFGVPSPSQSAAVAAGGSAPGPPGAPMIGAVPAGRMIGERDLAVYLPRSLVKIASRKRVAFLPPVPLLARNFVIAEGTTTSRRVFVA